MTIQQQICDRILNMSDEGAVFINQVINNMNPVLFVQKEHDGMDAGAVDVSKRIGIGRGIIDESEDFDKWDDEIADLFEGVGK